MILASCHFDDSRDRCTELSKSLYDARQAKQPLRIRSVLTSSSLTEQERETLVSETLDRDAILGDQESREEYFSHVSRKGTAPDHWYLVRNGYRIRYKTGETWEEVLCRVDDLGRAGAIIGVNFGPVPGK